MVSAEPVLFSVIHREEIFAGVAANSDDLIIFGAGTDSKRSGTISCSNSPGMRSCRKINTGDLLSSAQAFALSEPLKGDRHNHWVGACGGTRLQLSLEP